MNIFHEVKDRVLTIDAAQYYGYEVKRNGMMCCPFHNDKTPSMKVDKRFHCFGCGEDGDVVKFVSLLFGLDPFEAAKKIAYDFNILNADNEYKPERIKPTKTTTYSAEKKHLEKVERTYIELLHCRNMMEEWKVMYAPDITDDDWDPRFCTAVKYLPLVNYKMEILTTGTEVERILLLRDSGTTNLINKIRSENHD